jgi:hypothetical protein
MRVARHRVSPTCPAPRTDRAELRRLQLRPGFGRLPVLGKVRHPGAPAAGNGQRFQTASKTATSHTSCVQPANDILFPGPCEMMHTCCSCLHNPLGIRQGEQRCPDSARQWRLDFESLTPPIRAVAGRGTCCPTTQPSAGRAAAVRRVSKLPRLGDLDRLCGHFLVRSRPMAWRSGQGLI